MQRQRGELVPIGEVIGGLDGPVKAIREASPQARRGFTRFDQVNQLVSASEADPDLGASWRGCWRCAACPAPIPATVSNTSASTAPSSSYMICRAVDQQAPPRESIPAPNPGLGVRPKQYGLREP